MCEKKSSWFIFFPSWFKEATRKEKKELTRACFFGCFVLEINCGGYKHEDGYGSTQNIQTLVQKQRLIKNKEVEIKGPKYGKKKGKIRDWMETKWLVKNIHPKPILSHREIHSRRAAI